jgi:hypothetical protein
MADDPKLHGILSSEIDEAWPDVAPIIEKALPYSDGKYELEDIYKGIQSRDLQLWAASREGKATSVMVTKIIQYPKAKTLLMMIYAGEHTDNMTQFLPPIYTWAKKLGCTDVEIYGRAGWERVLKDQGYEKIHTVLRRKI